MLFGIKMKSQSLPHFMSLITFYTPRMYQKISGLLMCSGGVERDQWSEMA